MSRDAFDAHGNRRVFGSDAPPKPAIGAPTPGQWFVRTRVVGGEIVDCFVAAPDCQGLAYGAEIMGDDEYTNDPDMSRKLADAHLIAAAPGMAALLRETLQPGAYGSRSTLAARIEALLATAEGKTTP